MSTATKASTGPKAAPVIEREVVMTFAVGPGGLGKFIDVVPEPPGRVRYRDGSVTIVSPSPPHEHELIHLDDVIITICEVLEIAASPAGSTLFRRDDLERGVMPDRAYYIQHQGAIDKVEETVDLGRYPPPDLVVEVVWTHGPSEALEILEALKMPEVWVYDVPKRRLEFLVLGTEGGYATVPRSLSFPFLTPGDVLGQIQSIAPGEPHYRWKRRLREWVVGTIGPRRAGG
jgi:Uma2 family endonuclease